MVSYQLLLRKRFDNEGGNIILKQINQEIEKFENILNKLKKEVISLPEGRLRCTSSNGMEQFFVNGVYSSKNEMEFIQGIAQREYDENMISILEDNIKKLRSVQRIYLEKKMDKCYMDACDARKKLVTPACESLQERVERFLSEEYSPGVFSENNRTEFYTQLGERVRSKSELLIADCLYRNHVPYRYEKPLMLPGWINEIELRPDFTVMNTRTGENIIYEHLGMMDDSEYVERNMRKLDLYERNGYLIGKNLIITHETSTSPLNLAIVETYIETFFV